MDKGHLRSFEPKEVHMKFSALYTVLLIFSQSGYAISNDTFQIKMSEEQKKVEENEAYLNDLVDEIKTSNESFFECESARTIDELVYFSSFIEYKSKSYLPAKIETAEDRMLFQSITAIACINVMNDNGKIYFEAETVKNIEYILKNKATIIEQLSK